MGEQDGREEERSRSEARLRAIVHGRVQGVSFRFYATRAAQRIGVNGWVANRWDGTVETVAEGTREALNEFRTFLRQGSPYAFVERVDERWELPTGEFDTFKVRYL